MSLTNVFYWYHFIRLNFKYCYFRVQVVRWSCIMRGVGVSCRWGRLSAWCCRGSLGDVFNIWIFVWGHTRQHSTSCRRSRRRYHQPGMYADWRQQVARPWKFLCKLQQRKMPDLLRGYYERVYLLDGVANKDTKLPRAKREGEWSLIF